MSDLIPNLDKIRTTDLGIVRIKRNLDMQTNDIIFWCREAVKNADIIFGLGKNWYVYGDGVVITINSHSYTVITAHKINAKVRIIRKSDYDGYAGYHVLPPEVKVVGCWAHVRRKFDEAVKGAPPDARANLPSQRGLDLCNELFRLERDYENLKPEERYEERLRRSKPISDTLFEWGSALGALTKSLLGKAIH